MPCGSATALWCTFQRDRDHFDGLVGDAQETAAAETAREVDRAGCCRIRRVARTPRDDALRVAWSCREKPHPVSGCTEHMRPEVIGWERVQHRCLGVEIELRECVRRTFLVVRVQERAERRLVELDGPEVGALRGRAGMTNGAALVPLTRSPSTQCAIPGTFVQSVHCQNVQPRPPHTWSAPEAWVARSPGLLR